YRIVGREGLTMPFQHYRGTLGDMVSNYLDEGRRLIDEVKHTRLADLDSRLLQIEHVYHNFTKTFNDANNYAEVNKLLGTPINAANKTKIVSKLVGHAANENLHQMLVSKALFEALGESGADPVDTVLGVAQALETQMIYHLDAFPNDYGRQIRSHLKTIGSTFERVDKPVDALTTNLPRLMRTYLDVDTVSGNKYTIQMSDYEKVYNSVVGMYRSDLTEARAALATKLGIQEASIATAADAAAVIMDSRKQKIFTDSSNIK
ncbi:unnamed protein product, partial [marine sediment metagenome]